MKTDKSKLFYLFWKLFIFIYIVALIPYGCAVIGYKLPTHFTFWGWCYLAIYFGFSLVQYPMINPSSWVSFLQELCFTASTLITTVAGFGIAYDDFTPKYVFYNISYHVLNGVFMFIDVILYTHPFKLFNIIPILLLGGGIWLIFSLIYLNVTGRPIYGIITWGDKFTPLCFIGATFGAIVAFAFGFVFSRVVIKIKYNHRFGEKKMNVTSGKSSRIKRKY